MCNCVPTFVCLQVRPQIAGQRELFVAQLTRMRFVAWKEKDGRIWGVRLIYFYEFHGELKRGGMKGARRSFNDRFQMMMIVLEYLILSLHRPW